MERQHARQGVLGNEEQQQASDIPPNDPGAKMAKVKGRRKTVSMRRTTSASRGRGSAGKKVVTPRMMPTESL
jgi:hypothetical protein